MDSTTLDLIAKVYSSRGPLLNKINLLSPWHAIYRHRTESIIESIIDPGFKVIDMACGTGILANKIASKVNHITLVDALPCMLNIAKESITKSGCIHKANFYQGFVEDISKIVPDRGYSMATITQAANFLNCPDDIFRAASNLLADDGILYLDIDNPLRWSIIEALSGNIENAIHIIKNNEDVEKNIVGTNYYFHSNKKIMDAAREFQFSVVERRGVGYAAPMLHAYNQSSDFLDIRLLDDRSAFYLAPTNLDRLLALEILLEKTSPIESAGWTCYVLKKKSNQ